MDEVVLMEEMCGDVCSDVCEKNMNWKGGSKRRRFFFAGIFFGRGYRDMKYFG
jgi:hypothetical protein